MDQYRDCAMREDLDRLAAEHDRGDAVAAVRGHDYQIAALLLRGTDDCPIGMFILDLERLARDACRFGRAGDAQSFPGICAHTHFVFGRRVLDHPRIGRDRMKIGARTVSAVTFAPIRLASAMPCRTALPASSDPSVGIRMLVYIAVSSTATSQPQMRLKLSSGKRLSDR